ncbi:hypothetical protein [Nocardia veterana]|uniref:Uncharacterized protein n=1 Tax=Nocardia veterana TaxID=132249 RepID=A0A7X6M2D4_9NOCA|nr:hypothetical protein [Nocardia veterana]NKY88469.1 hypothetical protein [Nocardia veterana]
MGDAGRISVCVRAHRVNRWVLRASAIPYVGVDGADPVRLRWGAVHTFDALDPGRHRIEFTLRYRGFARPATRSAVEVELAAGEHAAFRVDNGPLNQDPFVFRRADGAGGN